MLSVGFEKALFLLLTQKTTAWRRCWGLAEKKIPEGFSGWVENGVGGVMVAVELSYRCILGAVWSITVEHRVEYI